MCIPVRLPEPYLCEAIAALDLSYVAEVLIDFEGPLRQARRRLAERARCDLILNLDADTILPWTYLPRAISLFSEIPGLGAVALMYAAPNAQDHAAFGTSLIPREVMLDHYGWLGGAPCECRYMWEKLEAHGLKVITLKDLRAQHRK